MQAEKEYLLVQLGETFARTDSKERAIRLAKSEATANGLDVYIEARRPVVRVTRYGSVVAGETGWPE